MFTSGCVLTVELKRRCRRLSEASRLGPTKGSSCGLHVMHDLSFELGLSLHRKGGSWTTIGPGECLRFKFSEIRHWWKYINLELHTTSLPSHLKAFSVGRCFWSLSGHPIYSIFCPWGRWRRGRVKRRLQAQAMAACPTYFPSICLSGPHSSSLLMIRAAHTPTPRGAWKPPGRGSSGVPAVSRRRRSRDPCDWHGQPWRC